MTKEVFFIADDFGMSESINEAILHAHRFGMLHGASLMTGQPATEHAVRLAKQAPTLQVGLHLHLNDSKPCTVSSWPWGRSPAKAGWAIGLLPSAHRLMQSEIARQWELFQASSLACAFVNSHHHLHIHPRVANSLFPILDSDFAGWIRFGMPRFFSSNPRARLQGKLIQPFLACSKRKSPWPSSDTLWGIDRLFAMDPAEVIRRHQALPNGRHEFLFHPRHLKDRDTQCLLELRHAFSSFS